MSIEMDVALNVGRFAYKARLEASDEILVLFGRSGAGKSLTLQMVSGLVKPSAGRIVINGKTVFDSENRVNLPPQQRGVGYVVQDLALFPHMNVGSNIGFGATGGREEKRAKVKELMSVMGLEGMERRMPRTLSGGQMQRVAIARALACDAKVVLLDEPFSALDEELRRELRVLLAKLQRELNITILMVTHDLREAHMISDKLAIMDNGEVLNIGKRDAVFAEPLSKRDAALMGFSNLFEGVVKDATPEWMSVDMLGKSFRCVSWAGGFQSYNIGSKVDVAIRAERVNLRRSSESTPNTLRGFIAEIYEYGVDYTLRFMTETGDILEVNIGARPYEILGIKHKREWVMEMPEESLHVMKQSGTASHSQSKE